MILFYKLHYKTNSVAQHSMWHLFTIKGRVINHVKQFNPLNAKLNPISHLLVLLRAHHILHISRIRVKTLFSLYYRHISGF